MSIEIIKNLTILHRIDEDLDSDDETVCFVGHAEILYHGAKVSTEIHEGKTIMKDHFEVTVYDWGDGDLQIGDEQTIFYIDGERAGLFWELPDELQTWATQEVKRIFQELNKK